MTRVLVVEDDPEVNALVAYKLAQAGYEVTPVTDGAAALEAVAATPPDVLVLDIMLPGLSGLEVLRQIREGGGANLPVIMLTARAGEDDVERGFQLGADDYMTKPFSPRELVSRVRAVLARART